MSHLSGVRPGELLVVGPSRWRLMVWADERKAAVGGEFVPAGGVILVLSLGHGEDGTYALVVAAGRVGYVLLSKLRRIGP